MSAIGQALRDLRHEKGWTLEEAAERLGLTNPGMLSKRERGEVSVKRPEWKTICKVYGLTAQQWEDRWRASVPTRSRGGNGIPVINRAPAGRVVDYHECGVDSGQGWEYLDWGNVKDDLAFAVIVTGDSMEDTLFEGDYLILSTMNMAKPRAKLEDGSVVFVRFTPESRHNGCTIARWHSSADGVVTLTKDNPQYRPISCSREEVEQLAVAIEKRTKRL